MNKKEDRSEKLLNLKENVFTERKHRINFYLKNQDKFEENKVEPRKRRDAQFKPNSINCEAWEEILRKQEEINRKLIEASNIPKQVERPIKEDKPPCLNMRPASPITKSTIYSGLCKEGLGRCLYLKKRAEISPKEKYVYPMVSSWDYGWDQPDLPTMIKDSNSRKGRRNLIEKALYSTNGIKFELLENVD